MQQLVSAGSSALDLEVRQVHQHARVVSVALEQLAADDHVKAALLCGPLSVVHAFGPSQHVEQGHDIHADSLFGSDLRHEFGSPAKGARQHSRQARRIDLAKSDGKGKTAQAGLGSITRLL